MGNEITFEQVKRIIEKYLKHGVLSQAEMELPLLEFEIDSFGRLELSVNLEDNFKVCITDEIIWSRSITVLEFIEAVQKSTSRD